MPIQTRPVAESLFFHDRRSISYRKNEEEFPRPVRVRILEAYPLYGLKNTPSAGRKPTMVFRLQVFVVEVADEVTKRCTPSLFVA